MTPLDRLLATLKAAHEKTTPGHTALIRAYARKMDNHRSDIGDDFRNVAQLLESLPAIIAATPQQDRDAEIIALREVNQLTYREIGEWFGITKERVRQILNECGREDLTGHAISTEHVFGPPTEWHCEICGAQKLVRGAKVKARTCSRECLSVLVSGIQRLQRLPESLIKRMIAQRRKGATWHEINLARGVTSPTSAASFLAVRRWVALQPDPSQYASLFGYNSEKRPPRQPTKAALKFLKRKRRK